MHSSSWAISAMEICAWSRASRSCHCLWPSCLEIMTVDATEAVSFFSGRSPCWESATVHGNCVNGPNLRWRWLVRGLAVLAVDFTCRRRCKRFSGRSQKHSQLTGLLMPPGRLRITGLWWCSLTPGRRAWGQRPTVSVVVTGRNLISTGGIGIWPWLWIVCSRAALPTLWSSATCIINSREAAVSGSHFTAIAEAPAL